MTIRTQCPFCRARNGVVVQLEQCSYRGTTKLPFAWWCYGCWALGPAAVSERSAMAAWRKRAQHVFSK